MENQAERKSQRKTRVGTVTSNKMDRSIVVRIDRTMRHHAYQRIIRRSTNLMAHDEKNQANIGDRVRVMETRPLSKQKRWRLVEVIEKTK